MSSCKEIIDIFEMVGGKFVCNYDKRTCELFPQNISSKIVKKNKEDLGHLISQYAYSGHFNDFVTMLPESEERKKSNFVRELIHDYQEKKYRRLYD
jgi:hypothetical protein